MPRTRSAGLRDRLVAAADELLDGAAPANLTTRQIARHAAVSDGVLYNHFGDKDELLVAALVRRYGRLVEAFEAQVREADDAAAQGSATSLAAWLRSFARALRDLDAAALHLAAGLMAEPALLDRFWLEIHRAPLGLERLMGPIAGRLERERDAGRLAASADLGAAVNLVFGAAGMGAITLRVNAHNNREVVDRSLDASVDLVLAGLTVGSPSS